MKATWSEAIRHGNFLTWPLVCVKMSTNISLRSLSRPNLGTYWANNRMWSTKKVTTKKDKPEEKEAGSKPSEKKWHPCTSLQCVGVIWGGTRKETQKLHSYWRNRKVPTYLQPRPQIPNGPLPRRQQLHLGRCNEEQNGRRNDVSTGLGTHRNESHRPHGHPSSVRQQVFSVVQKKKSQIRELLTSKFPRKTIDATWPNAQSKCERRTSLLLSMAHQRSFRCISGTWWCYKQNNSFY